MRRTMNNKYKYKNCTQNYHLILQNKMFKNNISNKKKKKICYNYKN